MLTGNTTDSLYKNVISELLAIDAPYKCLSFTRNPARLTTNTGTEIFCVGINSEGAEDRIQGGSVSLWYADEPTTYPETAFNMCLSRCRGKDETGELTVPMPAMFTLNPDEEDHYIKRMIDTATDDTTSLFFDWHDNPSLTKENWEKLTATFVGDFRERMVNGKWVGRLDQKIIPEATTYDDWVCSLERPKKYRVYGGLDVGFGDKAVYLLGYHDFLADTFVIIGEWAMRGAGTPDIAKGILELEASLGVEPFMRWSDIDLRLIDDMSRQHGITMHAVSKTMEGGGYVTTTANYIRLLFSQHKIKIAPSLTSTIRALKTGRWKKGRDGITNTFERTSDGHNDEIAALFYLIRGIDNNFNPYHALDGLDRRTSDISGIEQKQKRTKEFETHGL